MIEVVALQRLLQQAYKHEVTTGAIELSLGYEA